MEVAPKLRLHTAALLGLLLLSASACAPEPAQRRYHERWQSALNHAYATGEAPRAPEDVPRLARDSIEPLYQQAGQLVAQEHEAWRKLLTACERTADAAELLQDAVEAHDAQALRDYAPLAKAALAEQARADTQWQAASAAVQDWGGRMELAWDNVWPEHDLKVGLSKQHYSGPGTASYSEDGATAVKHYVAARGEVLTALKHGKEAPPAVAEAPRNALQVKVAVDELERMLRLRNRLRREAAEDVAQVEKLTGRELSLAGLRELKLRPGTYTAEKVDAAVARLKLAGLLLTALERGIELGYDEAVAQWHLAVPGIKTFCPLLELEPGT